MSNVFQVVLNHLINKKSSLYKNKKNYFGQKYQLKFKQMVLTS